MANPSTLIPSDDTLSPSYINQLRANGYISSQQAANPASIPVANGDVDWSDPQFKGLSPLAQNGNSLDQAALQAATPSIGLGGNVTAGGDPTAISQGAQSNTVTASPNGQVNNPPNANQAVLPTTDNQINQSGDGVASPTPPKGIGAFPGQSQSNSGSGGGSGLSPETAVALANAHFNAIGRRPTGWIPTSRKTEGTAYSPNTINAIQNELGDQGAAAQADLEAKLTQGGAQSLADKQMAIYDEADAQQIANLRQRQTDYLDATNNHLNDLMAKADAYGHIDPDRWMHSKSAGSRIGMALAMGLGQFGAAITHSPNAAMDIIQKEIDRDVDAQKQQAENSRAAVGQAANLYQLNRERLGDNERATLATQAALRQTRIAQLSKFVNDTSAPAATRAWAAQTQAGLSKSRADILKELDEKSAHNITEEKFQQPQIGGADPLARLKYARDIRNTSKELTDSDIDTLQKQANIGKTEADINKENATTKTMTNPIDAFEKAGANLRSTSLWTNPYGAVAQNVQGTDAQEAKLQREGYNSIVMAQLLKTHQGLARNKERFDQAVETYMVQPNDTDKTLERKKALARQNLFNGPNSEGVPTGAGEAVEPNE